MTACTRAPPQASMLCIALSPRLKRLSKLNTVCLSKFAVTRLAGFSAKLAHKCIRLNYRVPTPTKLGGVSKSRLSRCFKRMNQQLLIEVMNSTQHCLPSRRGYSELADTVNYEAHGAKTSLPAECSLRFCHAEGHTSAKPTAKVS